MNKWVFAASIFCVMLNLASLILPVFIPGISEGGTFGVPEFSANVSDPYKQFADTASNPESPMTDKGNLIYRLLDMINIGLIKSFSMLFTGITSVLFAFPKLMLAIVTPLLETPEQIDVIKYTLWTIFSIGYGFFIFGLWSGRDLREG